MDLPSPGGSPTKLSLMRRNLLASCKAVTGNFYDAPSSYDMITPQSNGLLRYIGVTRSTNGKGTPNVLIVLCMVFAIPL